MSRPIIIDCDPGVDDAIAILVAAASPSLNILGLTTVAGNVPLSVTTRNALDVCALAQRSDIPVYAGCPRPLLQPLQTARDVHGNNGLQGVTLPPSAATCQLQHGVDFLIETLLNAPSPLTLATLGPLTNVAIALIKAPQIANHIQEIVAMGGAITQGNITPSAEFNLYTDPHAAQVVFASGIPLTLIPLDATHQVLTTPERLATLRKLGTPIAQVAADMLTGYGQPDVKRENLAGAPLHDPCVIAYLLQPQLFSHRPAQIQVETVGIHTLGRTVIDWEQSSMPTPPHQIIHKVDGEAVYQLLIESLAQL